MNLKNADISQITDLDLNDHDPLVSFSSPYAFLYVKNLPLHLSKKVSDIFDLSQSSNLNEVKLLPKAKNENYKIDILKLTAAALYLLRNNSNIKLFLGVSQALRGLLDQKDLVEKDCERGEFVELNNFDYSSSALTLSPAVQLCLIQCNFNIEYKDANLVFNHIQASNLLEQFMNGHKNKKVG